MNEKKIINYEISKEEWKNLQWVVSDIDIHKFGSVKCAAEFLGFEYIGTVQPYNDVYKKNNKYYVFVAHLLGINKVSFAELKLFKI